MVDLYELKQLAAFADLGTLSRVAEEFHLSTPSVTRSMQHLEQYFGVPLFTRGKNKIGSNETGKLAVDHARKLLAEAEQAVARHTSLTFAEINGFNFLLRTELGFWDALCREKMPSSKFLVQTDTAVFDEVVRASSLPCFTTDHGQLRFGYPSRDNIPLTDEEAHVTFYLAKKHGR